jgi:hypothetical protein
MNPEPFYVWYFYVSVALVGLFTIIGIGLLVSHFFCRGKGGAK